MSVDALEAVRKSIVVAAPVEKAWEVFTERIGTWWPFAGHSLGGDETETAVIAPDRIFERWKDGSEHTWGRMLVWDPPRRLRFTWEVHPAGQTEVELRFTPEGDGTRVELEHRSWEALGERAEAVRGSYDTGWGVVLGKYVDAVGPSSD